MRTDEGMAHLRAASRAAAGQTGAAIARKHVRYITDLLTFVRTLRATPDEGMPLDLWAAYLRETISGMCSDVGSEAANEILRNVVDAAKEAPDAH